MCETMKWNGHWKSKLSENQTRLIFETNTLDAGEGIPVDDVLETDL